VAHGAPLEAGLRPQPDDGPTKRPRHSDRHRSWLHSKAVWLLAAVAVGAAALLPLALEPLTAAEGVLNGSAAVDLSGWRAAADAEPITLTRVPITGGPSGVSTAVDIRRAAGRGRWAMVLADLRTPETFFKVGHSYRMRVFVRDMRASGQSVGLLLANANYLNRPTGSSRYERYSDTSWHLLTRTFVCAEPGSADTALYVELPPSGALHWQVTEASVREVPPARPPRIRGPATKLLPFTGPAGTPLDPQVWSYDLGGNGWGNKELQTYTSSASNAQVDGIGNLVITARREDATGPDGTLRHYTSARITTKGKVEVQPGSYVEASIRAPVGAGVWPAFWLVGSNISEVGWPACGELDVVEGMGANPAVAHSGMHMATQSDRGRDAPYGGGRDGGDLNLGHPLDSRAHLYGVYFDYTMVRFYIDRKEHMAFGLEDALASGRTWPFGNPQYLVLNVAVGGAAGNPSATSFPKSMTVGAISIWQGGTPF
jgi:Glycosyl hydrolases family 16